MDIPQKFEIDFTEEAITSSAGNVFLSGMAHSLSLKPLLQSACSLKRRRRGASDADTLLAMVYALAQGDGKLSDLDRLGVDDARVRILQLEQSPGSRRAGEYLRRFDSKTVERLRLAASWVMRQVGLAVVHDEEQRLGYVPLFVDGSAIEVSGNHFEEAGVGYNGLTQYWLHSVFVGRMWASQQLWPGGVSVTAGWKEQLDEVSPLLSDSKSVWLRTDNAYYDGKLVDYCTKQGWDYSISVTSGTFKKPLLRQLDELDEEDWHELGPNSQEDAVWLCHRPSGWQEKQVYVVVRTKWDGKQRLVQPRYTFILTNRADLDSAEVVQRHRGKQGQENAQKGPLIDMDLHHPPCRHYQANRAYYTLGQIAQLLLCAIQYKMLPKAARRHGIRTIIRDLIRTAGKLVHHSRKWLLKFSKATLRLDWIARAAEYLEHMGASPG